MDQIANLIAKQYNVELGENLELANLQAQLKEIDKQIESLIAAIMNGLNSKSIELKIKQLENEKSILTEKMVLSESHQTKPIKPEDIKHFIYYFMSKDYLNHNERVEFFTKFISKIIYYNDRLIIIYNTKPNDSEEIVINSKEDIEKIENTIKDLEEKKSFSVNHAERQVNGGEHRIRTCGRSHVNGFQDRRFKPLSQFSTFVLRRSENRCNGLPKQDAWFDIKFCWSLLISEK